jgi:hypothetical protein
MKMNLQSLLYPVSLILPNFLPFNYAIAAIYFLRANGRLPRNPDAPDAAINDFIFHRMIANRWNLLQKLCVDKQYAKMLAAQVPGVKLPRTVAVYNIDANERVESFLKWLEPHLGKRLVAKPTHGSGKVLFLDHDLPESEIRAFFALSKRNFFRIMRETQYLALERKILVEENISKEGDLNDFKFFCADGRVLYCQIDVDRFTDHRRVLCTIPEFKTINVKTKFLEVPDEVVRPRRLDEMVRIAGQLSKEFDFVRIDLYDADDGVYFGEFTFTPGAGCDNFSNAEFASEFLRTVNSSLNNTI